MGIHDRDYYRESPRGWWSPFGDRPVTLWVIALCCTTFFLQLLTLDQRGQRDQVTDWCAFHLPSILEGQVWRVVTAHFLHTGLWHLAFNMLVLYWVGSELEGIYGSREFLGFYAVAALLISGGRVLLGLVTPGQDAPALLASGPVAAAFVLFACHYPYRTIYVFFILPVPCWLVAVGIIVIDFVGFAGAGRAGVGYAANLLGAAFGFVYYKYTLRVSTWVPRLFRRRAARRPSGIRLFQEPAESSEPEPVSAVTPLAPKAAATTTTAGKPVDEQLEAKLDLVLEKVSRYGRDSLTAEERDLLVRASEIYKQRRGQ